MVRALALFFLIVASLPLWSVTAQSSTKRAEVTFEFTEAVSTVDRVSIEQGIRFAQDAYIGLFGSDAQGPVTVTVDYDETGQARHGVRNSRQIFINAWNYRGMSALVQTMSVVHEYFHIWQFGQSRGFPLGPYWLVEGSAEFISYWVLAQARLVSYDDVHEFFIQMANGARAQEPVNLPVLSELTDPDAMFAPGAACCSYHLSALALELLVEEQGVEALGTYFTGLRAPGGGTRAFEDAFGQSVEEFYQAFEEQRTAILTSSGRDVTPLLLTPPFNEGWAEVSLTNVPEVVERGEQVILTGATAPGVLCSLTLTSADGKEPLSYPTYADSYGFVFWLWTLQEDTDRGTAGIEVACGGLPVTTTIDVA
ncbi:MAG: hypothetical protein M3Q03_17165 [Chloroflexota bacterium]|nr:hypothetical protein [Chloroflexota bacterium]